MDYELEWGKGDCPARENGIPMDRRLLAKSFLSGVGKMIFIAMGNCSRKVSYPAWGNGIHLDGKLFFLVLQ